MGRKQFLKLYLTGSVICVDLILVISPQEYRKQRFIFHLECIRYCRWFRGDLRYWEGVERKEHDDGEALRDSQEETHYPENDVGTACCCLRMCIWLLLVIREPRPTPRTCQTLAPQHFYYRSTFFSLSSLSHTTLFSLNFNRCPSKGDFYCFVLIGHDIHVPSLENLPRARWATDCNSKDAPNEVFLLSQLLTLNWSVYARDLSVCVFW